jgi:hypothetical protein
VRQSGAVYALCPENVDVVKLAILLWRESLGRIQHHVAGIVDDNIEPSVVADDLVDGRVDRFLRQDVELDGAQVDPVFGGISGRFLYFDCVTSMYVAHAGIDNVAVRSEVPGRKSAESAGSIGDDDDFAHDRSLPKRWLER